MRIAVITPYSSESAATLNRCIDSVAGQTHACTHILVGDGRELSVPEYVQHIRLPKTHDDWGDTPRLIGTASAYAQGYDGICWLDGDCWLEAFHIERLLEIAAREMVSVVTTTRNLTRQDGSLLGVCTESNGRDFCDTNCYLVMREAIPILAAAWGWKDRAESVIGDRYVWDIAKKMKTVHYSEPTVNYETKIANHYLDRQEKPPHNARVIVRLDGDRHFRSVLYYSMI